MNPVYTLFFMLSLNFIHVALDTGLSLLNKVDYSFQFPFKENFRLLNETNMTLTNTTENFTDFLDNNCNSIKDCFNCTMYSSINLSCKWTYRCEQATNSK
jgi:hypothetical protein